MTPSSLITRTPCFRKNSALLILFILAIYSGGCAPYVGHGIELGQPDKKSHPTEAIHDDGVRLALVLSGGASRGFAHVGVIKVLEDENIPVDMVVGTSMGAMIGAMYASGLDAKTIETFTRQAIDKSFRLLNISVFSRGKHGLLDFTPFQEVLAEQVPYRRIEEFPLAFGAIATDLNTGEQVVFREGPVITALSATAAVPGIFSPVLHHDHWLVDGGLVNNLPADVAHQAGADLIIAVNTMKEPGTLTPESYLDILKASLHVVIGKSGKPNESFADVLIYPSFEKFQSFDFSVENLDIMMKAGEDAARKQLPAIKKKLRQAREMRIPEIAQNTIPLPLP